MNDGPLGCMMPPLRVCCEKGGLGGRGSSPAHSQQGEHRTGRTGKSPWLGPQGRQPRPFMQPGGKLLNLGRLPRPWAEPEDFRTRRADQSPWLGPQALKLLKVLKL